MIQGLTAKIAGARSYSFLLGFVLWYERTMH